MRTKILLLAIAGTIAALLISGTAKGQDNTAGPTQPDLMATNGFAEIGRGILDIGKDVYSAMPSNNTVAIYGTYVLKPGKWGFGIVDAYNITTAGGVGVVAGVDYLGGQFLGVNGGIQLKHTFIWNHFSITPFVITALTTPLKGGGSDNGTLGTINSAGANVAVYKKFSLGGCYGTRTGAGSYGGGYVNGYFSLSF